MNNNTNCLCAPFCLAGFRHVENGDCLAAPLRALSEEKTRINAQLHKFCGSLLFGTFPRFWVNCGKAIFNTCSVTE